MSAFAPSRCFRTGFTLVELVVVLVITGVLSAIAVPRLSLMAVRSAAASTQQSFAAFEEAMLVYADENDGFPPDPGQPGEYIDELDGYIDRGAWDAVVPIGGRWDWVGPSRPSYSGVSVYSIGAVPPGWLPFDRVVDDGSFLTGRYRRTGLWLCRPLVGASKERPVPAKGPKGGPPGKSEKAANK